MTGQRNASVAFILVTLLLSTVGLGVIIPVLPSLVGLDNVAAITGRLIISFDSQLTSLGMDKLTVLSGGLTISDDPALSADDIAAFRARLGKH